MRIAQIAPVIENVPPRKYGGTERMVYALTEELVKRGHKVTLFASGGSKTSARLFPLFPTAVREMNVEDLYGCNWARLLGAGLPYQYQDEFDIIHDHNEPLSVPIAHLSQTPVVMTLHGAFITQNQKLYEKLNRPYLVSISRAQIPPGSKVNHIATIHHGFAMDDYPFSDKAKDYLLYVGRISPEKGVHNAIAVAKKVKKQLILAAKLDTKDIDYFKEKIEPELNDQILWIGEVNEEQRNYLMSHALCFLHPIEWAEPFGLTLIEAMACGAPVIAVGKGSIPEIVQHGTTGFVVDSIEEMAQAIKHVDEINRRTCREYTLQYFNSERMTDEYEMVYKAILAGKQQKKHNFTPQTFQRQSVLHKNDGEEFL
jgi:glycosyltransferase involved in cell wall biosynthesis